LRDPLASVVLIGMRGSGKTHIGSLAASALGWACIDADKYLEQKLQTGVREFVHQHGWPAFRAAETELLGELLAMYPTKHIISLGGGIVETPAARELLKTYADRAPVVYITRPIDEIIRYLGEETARPAYGEPVADVYRRRQPWFVECSNSEFVNIVESAASVGEDAEARGEDARGARRATEDEVRRFFGQITGTRPNHAANLAPGRRSYFLSLTYPDIVQALPKMEELTAGVDAVELRVDLLRSIQDYDTLAPNIPSVTYVTDQIVTLRRTTSLPIVFTVRTVSQGGAFPDSSEGKAFELLNLALRLGVEYIDVEICWSEKEIRRLCSRKGASKIIASWHDWSGSLSWTGPVVVEKYQLACQLGDIIKIVGKAKNIQDNFALFGFVSQVSATPNAKPIIAINMGVEGQMSRILNGTLSPVSHPLLPTKAAPGQLSFAQIQAALHLIGQLPARRFFLFGNPISRSMSPTLHNSGFEVLGLPHTYELFETSNVGEEIKAIIASPEFGGASVTIPFKVDVIPLLDKLSPAAEAIGAVNTIIPRATHAGGADCILYGDNTDWLGIRECILSQMMASQVEAALVIGAGGTARAAIYALHSLDTRVVYLYNRTRSKAQVLAGAFPDVRIEVIDDLGQWPAGGSPPNVIVSTLPGSATTVTADGLGNAVYLPSTLFAAREGVVVDMAYSPSDTPLIGLTKTVAGKRWRTVAGIEALLEQGYVQFEMWTGRQCPRRAVVERVMTGFLGRV
jgi:pentafunctional AROM polypeptide